MKMSLLDSRDGGPSNAICSSATQAIGGEQRPVDGMNERLGRATMEVRRRAAAPGA